MNGYTPELMKKTLRDAILLAAGLLAIIGVIYFAACPARADEYTPGWQSNFGVVPLGYQQITALTASTALTVPVGAGAVMIVPETQAVRWRDDGTAPTATVGFPLAVATPLFYRGNLAALRFIEQTASAKINIVYYP